MAPPLIGRVKEEADKALHDVQLIDAPPGASCPVIGALQGADRVVLVTEPTPFGLHDLKLAVGLVRKLGYPFGVVINRAGMGDERVERYLEEENIPLLASFPHSIEGAAAYSRGDLLIDALPGFEQEYARFWQALSNLNSGGVRS
jgi:MinD superfamily P-loop ATPase